VALEQRAGPHAAKQGKAKARFAAGLGCDKG
jgi:hypothetical protein